MLSVFLVPFCVLVVPSVMLTRKIGPRFTIPGYMFGWGVMGAATAGAKTFAGVLILRISKSFPSIPQEAMTDISSRRVRSWFCRFVDLLPHYVLHPRRAG